MIVANVPFCTSQVTPSTLATALRRSTSRPTFWPLTWPACGRPEVPGLERGAQDQLAARPHARGQLGVQLLVFRDPGDDVLGRDGGRRRPPARSCPPRWPRVGSRCRGPAAAAVEPTLPRSCRTSCSRPARSRPPRRGRPPRPGCAVGGADGPGCLSMVTAGSFRLRVSLTRGTAGSHRTAARNARARWWLGLASTRAGGPDSTMRPLVEEHDGVGHLAGEADLVGDHDHRHPAGRQVADHRRAPRRPVPGRARWSARRTASAAGCSASARAIATRCCCPPDSCRG